MSSAASHSEISSGTGEDAVRLRRFSSLALRGMNRRKGRTLLTVAAVAIGVAVILAVDVSRATTLISIHNLFDEISGRANLVVQPAATGSRGLSQVVAQDVRGVDGVVAVAPVVQVQTTVVGAVAVTDSPFAAAPQGGLTLLGVDPALEPDVHHYDLVAGRPLHVGDDRVALVAQGLADSAALAIGDDLSLVTAQGSATFTVVGVIDNAGAGRAGGGQVVIAPLPVVQALFDLHERLTRIDVVVERAIAGDTSRLDRLQRTLARRLPPAIRVDYPASRGEGVTQTLATYDAGLSLFGIVAIFVGSFLIYNAFAMTVLARTREIGMLRAIGATRRQIFRLVLVEACALGLAGSLLGLVAGVGLARALVAGMGAILASPLDTFVVPAGSLVKSVAAGLGVTMVSAYLPARRGSRISPLAALRVCANPQGQGRGRHWRVGLLLLVLCSALIVALEWLPQERRLVVGSGALLGGLLGAALTVPLVMTLLGPLLRRALIRFYGPPGWIGDSNIRRAPSRSALTVAALMIGVAVVVAFGEEVHSLRSDVLQWVDSAIGGDLYVRAVYPLETALGEKLQQVPGVQAVTATTFSTTTLLPSDGVGQPVNVRAIDPAEFLRVGSFKFDPGPTGRLPDPASRLAALGRGDAVFVSTTLADRFGIVQGDTVGLETREGRRNFTVVAVVVDLGAQGNILTMSRGDLRRYFGRSGVHMFAVKATPAADVAAMVAEIESRYGEKWHVAVTSSAALRERLNGLMNQQSAILYALVGIALVVAALGIINTLMMSLLERRREIGMLRSVGMSRGQIARMVLAESASLGIVGSLLGLALGLPLAHVLIIGANVAGGYRFGYTFTAVPLALGLLIGLSLSQLAALYPARRAVRINILDAIKPET